MPIAKPVEGTLWQLSAGTLMGHLQSLPTGADIQQADITSIALVVQDKAVPGVNVATDTPVVATVIFDTLQTRANNPIWTKNAAPH